MEDYLGRGQTGMRKSNSWAKLDSCIGLHARSDLGKHVEATLGHVGHLNQLNENFGLESVFKNVQIKVCKLAETLEMIYNAQICLKYIKQGCSMLEMKLY